MKKNSIINLEVLEIKWDKPIIRHDIPVKPDPTDAYTDMLLRLVPNLHGSKKHSFVVEADWHLNQFQFNLISFKCTTRFGLMTEHELTADLFPFEDFYWPVRDAFSHARAALLSEVKENEYIGHLKVRTPLLREVIEKFNQEFLDALRKYDGESDTKS